jgi:hypothetical protein
MKGNVAKVYVTSVKISVYDVIIDADCNANTSLQHR